AFWSTMNYDMVRKLLDNEAHLKRVENKVDLVLKRTNALFADLQMLPSSLLEQPTGAWAAETPTEHLSIAIVCWIHRIVTENDKLPEAVRGRLRAINVWIGPAGKAPENVSFSPPEPSEIVQMMNDLFNWWTSGYGQLRGGHKEAVSAALAELHHRFLSIHPFLDGNGRVARVLLDQAARELLNMRIGTELIADTKIYYEALAAADQG